MIEWQPIETAPKDGTSILGFDGEDMAVVQYYMAETLGWWEICDEIGFCPSHWMPLPEPPK